MPRIRYQNKKLRKTTLQQIQQANEIIAEYQQAGFDLTLRQLYYQFVARDLIPNNIKEYDKLGAAVVEGRLSGLIDWDAIIDRTRQVKSNPHWTDPASIVSICGDQFQIDKWARQAVYIEVFIEKDALIGVIEGVCQENDVPYLACRGYTSVSEIWQAGHRRIRPKIQAGKSVVILYLGDHDPSGIDMTRDVRERLNLFAGHVAHEAEIKRIALNMDQIEQYDPPPNPTKMSDSRASSYVDQFGEECWELDALDPIVIRNLIQGEIDELRDQELWDEAVKEEQQGRADLKLVADNWDSAVDGCRE